MTCVRAAVSSWHSLSTVDILPKIKEAIISHQVSDTSDERLS